MATFKVGQRVRIIAPLSKNHGKQGTIWMINPNSRWTRRAIARGRVDGELAYRVDVDGVGRLDPYGAFNAYVSHQLAPLTDPRADEFIADMERFSVASRPKEIA